MTRPYSIAFKQKMVERLIGKDAVSAIQLARETGARQQSLSRWLQEASTLPFMATPKAEDDQRSVEQKARVLADASGLSGNELTAHLEAQGGLVPRGSERALGFENTVRRRRVFRERTIHLGVDGRRDRR